MLDLVSSAVEHLEANSDIHVTADYRRRVAAVLGARALKDAIAEASAGGGRALQ